MNYKGTIIGESLEDKSVLKMVKILSTRVAPVEESDATPWLKVWTLHKVEIDEDKAREVAEQISTSLDSKHGGSWYADYKNNRYHYIIFRNKIFKIDKKDEAQYKQAHDYGVKLGIPAHQLDWSKE